MGNIFQKSDFSFFPDNRADGFAKVTGRAKFTAEQQVPGLVHGVFVCSTIAKGYIKNMALSDAKRAPGVIDILWYLNTIKVPGYTPSEKPNADPSGEFHGLKLFNDNNIVSNGQPIALVLADTYERAVYAASLVTVQYHTETPHTDFDKSRQNEKLLKGKTTYARGEKTAWKNAAIKLEAEYYIPIETHNPMEMHGTIAVWEGDNKLTVYDKSQGPKSTQAHLAKMFALEEKNVKVITEYVGGAFGSALIEWPHVHAAIIAAKKINRPVKVTVTREQMFTTVGYRPKSWQKIGIGAGKDGVLTGITHEAVSNTSSYEDFAEGIVDVSQWLYSCPNVDTTYHMLPLDINSPIWMRGPGPATGCFGLECALDELSYLLNMDPVDLRLKNDTAVNPTNNLPWTSRFVKECLELGREKIGWHQRPAIAGTVKEDGMLVGYGMAVGVFWAGRWDATVKGILKKDGSLTLQSAVSDMGPGTSTAIKKIGSEQMGIDAALVTFQLGNTDFPNGPVQGGSGSAVAVGTAATVTCDELKNMLKDLAIEKIEAFKNLKKEELKYEQGNIFSAKDKSVSIHYTALLKQADKDEIDATKSSGDFKDFDKYDARSFSAHFVKLHVNPVTGVIKLKHIVSVADCGKIISEKTARSQMVGGAVGGIGMALTEETLMDNRYGRYINTNFVDYHVPVHADAPPMDILFVDKPDYIISTTGAKGVGEIALIGVAPAIANAVYNATGKRVRDLPVTPDKILQNL